MSILDFRLLRPFASWPQVQILDLWNADKTDF